MASSMQRTSVSSITRCVHCLLLMCVLVVHSLGGIVQAEEEHIYEEEVVPIPQRNITTAQVSDLMMI
jgi:hypothetical protein